MLHELKPTLGARHYKKRLGRGIGSGLGKTSGKGNKGQNARSGGGVRPGFEGGQLPLFQRIPKRGFKNINKVVYTIVNLEDLEVFDNGTVVDAKLLMSKGIIKKVNDGIKVLAKGSIDKKLTVKAHKFSAAAAEAIKKAGGEVEVI